VLIGGQKLSHLAAHLVAGLERNLGYRVDSRRSPPGKQSRQPMNPTSHNLRAHLLSGTQDEHNGGIDGEDVRV
jgi:hypothetical protein